MMEIRKVTRETAGDLKLKNEPFSKPGRFIPELKEGVWSYRVELYPEVQEETFPEENYDLAALEENGVVLGAYEEEICIGLAIFQNDFYRYFYLSDLKISKAHRGKGVGKALMEAGKREALARGYKGVYARAQDDNLRACMFYLRAGFEIGGFDNHVYRHTRQEKKGDILFYTRQEDKL